MLSRAPGIPVFFPPRLYRFKSKNNNKGMECILDYKMRYDGRAQNHGKLLSSSSKTYPPNLGQSSAAFGFVCALLQVV